MTTINCLMVREGLWDGEHKWEQWGWDDHEQCSLCEAHDQWPGGAPPCPGPEQWGVEELLRLADKQNLLYSHALKALAAAVAYHETEDRAAGFRIALESACLAAGGGDE